jgi:hypothetical protein
MRWASFIFSPYSEQNKVGFRGLHLATGLGNKKMAMFPKPLHPTDKNFYASDFLFKFRSTQCQSEHLQVADVACYC